LQNGDTIASWIIEHNNTQSIVLKIFLNFCNLARQKKKEGVKVTKGLF
jgi:hypothetical protein